MIVLIASDQSSILSLIEFPRINNETAFLGWLKYYYARQISSYFPLPMFRFTIYTQN